jgi:hypothetical protein
MYIVKVFPESISEYVSQIYAGLYDLSTTGKIKLEFANRFFHNTRELNKWIYATLCLEITDLRNGRYSKICFDMIDGMNIASIDDLKKADIYIKRSYNQSFINQLGQDLIKKIIPFGLHYACDSQNETAMMRMQKVYLYHSIYNNFVKKPVYACKQTFGQPFKLLLKKYKCCESIVNLPLSINDFEVHPDIPAEPKIYFRTRAYSPEDASGAYESGRLKELNDMRANTIRALRKHFGGQFVGGLKRSAFTEKYYPDLLSEVSSKKEHINLGKKHLICVTSSGLHDSTGWKFPEYLAASRCIVSEPPKFELPVPLEREKHYLQFTTPGECVDACRRLLNDVKLASSMRRENYTYYENYVRPSMIILRCLETALSKRETLSNKNSTN